MLVGLIREKGVAGEGGYPTPDGQTRGTIFEGKGT